MDFPARFAEKFLQATHELPIARYLASLEARNLIIGPAGLANAVAARAGPLNALVRETPDDIPPDVDAVYVLQQTPAGEIALKNRLSEGGGRRVYSICYDVAPFLVSGRDPRVEAGPGKHAYALISNPRTGSTFLCNLLEQAGLGRPKEHLRDDGIGYLLRSGADPRLMAERLMAADTHDGIFGTKFISHYLQTGLQDPPAMVAFLRWLQAEHGFIFFYLIRDTVEAVASYYVAKQTNIWAATPTAPFRELQRRYASIPYDRERLAGLYADFRRWDETMRAVLSAVPGAWPVFDYATLKADPGRYIRHVARTLAVDSAALAPSVDLAKSTASLRAAFPRIGEITEQLRQDVETDLISYR